MKSRQSSSMGLAAMLVIALVMCSAFIGCGKVAKEETTKEAATKSKAATATPIAPPAKPAAGATVEPTTPTAPTKAEATASDKAEAADLAKPDSAESTSAEPESEESLLGKIAKEEDLFALHTMKEAYEQRTEKSETVLAALMKRRDELVAKQKRETAIEGFLDFVAFDFKNITDGENEVRWYFIVTENMTDEWIFNPMFAVDKSHVGMLPPDRREAGNLSEAVFTDASKTPWEKGQHKVLSLKINLREVPYDISSLFYRWLPDKTRVFTKPIRHGWYVGFPG